MNINVGSRIQWVIGADKHDTVGPLRTGTVYAVYPKGTDPYWDPFLMVKMDFEERNINTLLNGPQRMAVLLNNPTLEVTCPHSYSLQQPAF